MEEYSHGVARYKVLAWGNIDRIRLTDYEPAFDAAIAVSRAEIDALVNNPDAPTFENTIVALERQGYQMCIRDRSM